MRLKYLKTLLFVLVISAGFGGTSMAAEYWLRAGAFTKTMPDTTLITMWGYALVQYDIGAGPVAGDNVLKVPGPAITVPPGQGLTIHLQNDLAVPTSIIIPGQSTTMIPTWTDGTTGARTSLAQRVRSLTHEAAAAGTADYTWATIKPGTYLYQSGTHQQVQVQMGLYGAVENDVALGQAYTGINYSKDVILLFSEIDPVIHGHVAGGTYGTAPPTGITSTVDFLPKYFLLNGEPYSSSLPPILAGNRGQNILFRLLNAGLKDYVPVFQGLHFSILAEDGNKLPFARSQYSLLLPAGKTMDAMVTLKAGAIIPFYDRRLSLTNNAASPGGLFNTLNFKGEPNVDFGGDIRSDLSFYRAGGWYIALSGGGTPDVVSLGGDASDVPVPGDYDGDGTTDIAIYRASTGAWYIIRSSTGAAYGVLWGGNASDVPAPGDYDGDGKTDIALYRVSAGAWYIIPSSTGVGYGVLWGGNASDLPAPGDYDGDGKTDIAVYRVSTGAWYIVPTSTGVGYGVLWGGNASDVPAPGDYDGDGKTDIALYRASTGRWYIVPTSTGVGYSVSWGGNASDLAAPGDYDGDGKTDVALYRASTGEWFIIPSSSGVGYRVVWGGNPGDIPITSISALY